MTLCLPHYRGFLTEPDMAVPKAIFHNFDTEKEPRR